MNIEQLRARLVELTESAAAIQATADAGSRDLSAEEAKQIDEMLDECDRVTEQIARATRMIEATASANDTTSAGRSVPGATPGANGLAAAAGTGNDDDGAAAAAAAAAARRGGNGLRNTTLTTPRERGRWGWQNMGDFAMAVRNAAINPTSQADPRLVQAAATTYGNEGTGSDGGFAVPPEWRAQIMEAVVGEEGLLARTDNTPVSGNTITFPVDETTAWQTSGGIQAYWDGEAAQMTQSKPALKDLTVKLHRLTALVPITDELLEDAQALGAYVSRKSGEKLNFKVNDAIINGTGAGLPLGLMNAPCLVSVAKETSQVAATFHANNVAKMMARMPAASFGRSTWLVNQDVLPQIMKMGFVVTDPAGTTAGGAGAIWLPPNGLQNSSTFGSLVGRPIFVTEACQTIGTKGDVVLADLTQYLSVVKSTGIVSTISIHLFFDQNMTAFRFVMRMNGQPWLSAPIARKNGSNTLSHFVTLDTRS